MISLSLRKPNPKQLRKIGGKRITPRATWKREPFTVAIIDTAVERAREALKDNPDLIASLTRTGHERALIYKTLV